jgi:L-ascorbate metabolism protein UlaG (beta-lactamase superfamily)
MNGIFLQKERRKNMKKIMAVLLLVISALATWALAQEYSPEGISFIPIKHATFVIKTKSATIYVDPVGDMEAFNKFPQPDIILLTDIHRDHLAPKLIQSLKQQGTTVVGPQAVVEKLSDGEILRNGEKKTIKGINIEAIPMYNLTAGREKFHPKGRGNGYILTWNNKRIYISGDTEDIKEMRSLKNIDYAFVCMNLPYTMTVDRAASAVLEMVPKVVIPYHYRGKGGLSDIEKFKKLVGKNKEIQVKFLPWYP